MILRRCRSINERESKSDDLGVHSGKASKMRRRSMWVSVIMITD
jgi:hypothetical protein